MEEPPSRASRTCPRCGPRCSRPWARSGPTKTWKRRPRRRRRARRPTTLIDTIEAPAPTPPFLMMCASPRLTSSRPKHCSRGPAGRELRRQMNRANPRGRRGPSLRPFDRDMKPGGCRSVEGQQKTQDRLNWLKAPASESSADASVIWAAADARLPRRSPAARGDGARREGPAHGQGHAIGIPRRRRVVAVRRRGRRSSTGSSRSSTGTGAERSSSTHHNAITRTSNQYYTHLSEPFRGAPTTIMRERRSKRCSARASFCTAGRPERPLGVLERHLSSI